ncbi:MAG: FimB/Mfa2 family fimbrial subunit [Bacteroidales bacterium]|nr:FimB/Mfa2 family fimbrial subunit [Bacteroidales bacterium]
MAPFLAGCIFDPPEECDNVSIVFRYQDENAERQISDYIEQVHLLVYGQDNKSVQQQILNFDGQSGIYYTTGLNLAPGRYCLVVAGNAFENTVLDASASLESLRLTSPAYLAGSRITGNDSLYLGQKEIEVSPCKWLQDTVDMASIHLNLNVLVRGLQGMNTKNGTLPVSIAMSGLRPVFSPVKGVIDPLQTYYPAGTYYGTPGLFVSRFNIFRGNDLYGVFLMLFDSSGQELERFNLGLLLEQAGLDPAHLEDISIPLEVVITGLEISIRISSWETEELKAMLQ